MSECEFPEFYHTSEPVARFERKCCECRAPILRGEKYIRCNGKWNGEPPKTYSQHALCAEICEFIRDELQSGDCIGFGYLHEWWGEEGRFYDRRDLPKVKKLRSMYARILKREHAER